jgi:hypothetical protein
MRIILWLLSQCGVRNVPAISTLRTLQKKLAKRTGTTTTELTSSVGNVFSVNDIRFSIAKVTDITQAS